MESHLEKGKFYVPDITEFHVGFEYEQVSSKMVAPKQWHKETFYLNTSHIDIVKYSELDLNVRVKYLDRDCIQSLGWEDGEKTGLSGFIFGEFQMYLHDNIEEFGYWFIQIYNWDSKIIFEGNIKNKSELKVLLKQLGI